MTYFIFNGKNNVTIRFQLSSFEFKDYFEYSSEVSTDITRNLFKNNLVLPRSKNSRTQRSIKYVGVKLWNSIPNSIKKLPFTKFKQSYKKFLLAKYINQII